jgi:predicted nucleic acid-binding protein
VTAYVDSSAIAKLVLLDESAHEQLAALLAAVGSIVSSRLTYVETRAAIASARRAGRLSSRDHEGAVAAIDALWPTVAVIDLTQAVAREAAEIAETFGLRAGDAVQLASLRRLGQDVPLLIAWDVRLRAAAVASGYDVYPPEA